MELPRVLRLQKGHKYCLLGKLSSEVGWNYYDTIRVSSYLLNFLFLLVNYLRQFSLSVAPRKLD